MTRITDPCPSCGQPSHRIHFPAHPRNNDGSALREIVAGIIVLLIWFVAVPIGLPIILEAVAR